MKNYFKKLALFLTVSLVLIISCSKNDDPKQNESLLDPVDDELNFMLASIPSDTSIQAIDLIFNGNSMIDFIQQYDPNFLNEHNVYKVITPQILTPENQKELLIVKMTLLAHSLVIRNNWTNYNSSNQPNGLAYNWGSKNHLQLKIPTNYPQNSTTPNICQEPLYGLDCSGMIYQMGLAAGVNLATGGANAEFERNETNWNNKFITSNDYKDLRAKLYKHTGVSITDPSYIDINGLKEGDLIFKTNNGKAIHVGMLLRTNVSNPTNLSIYQSNGKPQLGCDTNKSIISGPRIITLSSNEVFGSGKLFGVDWQVLRFETNELETIETVTIGSQVWMTKNLNVNKYRNGDDIPQVQDDNAWAALTTGAWCYSGNDTSNGPIYGKLYNWYAVNDPRGLAPDGFHVASDLEWNTLTTFLGGESVAGGKMKTITGWNIPNTAATNSSGFSGLPGGDRSFVGGVFGNNTYAGKWWSSTPSSSNYAWYRKLYYFDATITRDANPKNCGFSVRCIKD